MNKPMCFDSDKQYHQWASLARLSQLRPSHWYCADCTPEYKEKMFVAERCGFPEVTFIKYGKEIVGRRSEKEVSAERQKKLRDKKKNERRNENHLTNKN